MENYVMIILKYYINYTPNVGEITIWDTPNNMPTSDHILFGKGKVVPVLN
jgi:hypothetical protein